MMKRLILTLALAGSLFAADAPGWLKEIATSDLPSYPAKVAAAVLLDEETITLDATGRQLRAVRYAVKILNREGAKAAARMEYFHTDTGKVRDMKAWLIKPSGKVTEYGKNDAIESHAGSGLYDEAKVRGYNATRDADPGAVFGFESNIEERTVFSQYIHDFQDDLPALRSALILNLPTGWKAEGRVFRGLSVEAVEPVVSGSSFRWQMTKLPPFDVEPGAPRRTTLNPRLVVSTFPPGGGSGSSGHFQTWRDVSIWTSRFTDPASTVTPEIEAQASKITAGAKSEWDKIAALATHAQGIRYESVQLRLSRGGGYTPRPAAKILAQGYGDCKDKANYLRTLLKTVGVESYPVVIYSGDPRRARPEWPSPMQFNHAILAIRVPAATKAAAAFDFPAFGRMILFDPTDDTVPPGFLPDHEQDSFALMVAGDKGDLFKTPSTSPGANHLERVSKLKVGPRGELAASISEVFSGQETFDQRYFLKRQSMADYVKSVERSVGRSVAAAQISKVQPTDDPATHTFTTQLEFTAEGYAKTMQDRLMMVRPMALHYFGVPNLSDPKRTQPLLILPASFRERVDLQLPEGFKIDEMPGSGEWETDFGSFRTSYKADGGRVIAEREVVLRSAWIPVEGFKQAREFFGRINGAEQSPVVLVKVR